LAFSGLGGKLPADVRDTFLDLWLWVSAVGGSVVVIIANAPNPNLELLHPVFVALVCLQTAVWVAAFWRAGPPWYRIGALAAYVSFLSTSALVYIGPRTGVDLFLLFLVLLIGLTMGRRAFYSTVAGVLLLVAVAGYGWVTGVFPLIQSTNSQTSLHEPGYWCFNDRGADSRRGHRLQFGLLSPVTNHRALLP
jgi:hypothetical protein